MKRKLLCPFGLAICLCLPTLSATAAQYTVDDTNDPVLVEEGHSRSNQVADWTGVVGDPRFFKTDGINASLSATGILTINIFTNVPQSHALKTMTAPTTYHFYMADFGLDLDGDGFYEYGAVLYDHDYWHSAEGNSMPTATSLDVGVYEVYAWDTSETIFEEQSEDGIGGIGYGERFDEMDPKVAPVAIADGLKIGDLSVSQVSPISPEVQFRYTFRIDTNKMGCIGNSFNIFWAGSTCANDVVAAKLRRALFGRRLVEVKN